MTRKGKRLVIAASAIVFLLLGPVLFVWQEPFAARYEGATVREWCREFSASDQTPEDDVVSAFGTDAIPLLLSYFRVSLHYYQLRSVTKLGPEHNSGGQVAYEWIRRLYSKDGKVLDQILTSDAKAAPMLLKLLSISEPGVKPRLERATNSTIMQVQANAKAALR